MIQWTIEAALAAESIGRVVVSTEDDEIAAVAQRCGAEVPFRRPAELATDSVQGVEVALHCLDWLQEHEGYQPHCLALLQPTSPLRHAGDIDKAILRKQELAAQAIVGVSSTRWKPSWFRKLTPEGKLEELTEFNLQTLGNGVVMLNGAIFVIDTAVLRAQHTFTPAGSVGYLMPMDRAFDIDYEFDLKAAAVVLENALGPDGTLHFQS